MGIDDYQCLGKEASLTSLEQRIASSGLPDKLRDGFQRETETVICYVRRSRECIAGGRLVSQLYWRRIPGFKFENGPDNQILVTSSRFKGWIVIESKHYYSFGQAKRITEALGGSWS